MTMIHTFSFDTPVGVFHGASRNGALVASGFADQWDRLAAALHRRFPGEPWRDDDGSETTRAVLAYLAGDLDAIDGIEVDTVGTGFQRDVWAALRRIPVGETWSYAQLAAAVGNVGAVRAVGSANGANPASVVVPCHRVIRSDGSLGGYGGGLERKAWLLAHEGALIV